MLRQPGHKNSAQFTTRQAPQRRAAKRRAKVSRFRKAFPSFSLSRWSSSRIVQSLCTLFRQSAASMRIVGRATGQQYVGVGYGRQLRLEGLESRQMLAADLYVNDTWIITNDADLSLSLTAGDTVMSDIGAGDAAISGLIFGTDAFSTIQDAISAAALSDDNINVLTGAYSGALSVNKNVDIIGAGDADVSLNAGGDSTGIMISSGFDVSLSGITLSNFSATGIRTQGDLTLSNSTVDGGFVGVWVDGGTLDMTSSIVQNAMIFGVQVGGNTTIASSEISAVATSAASVIVSAGHAEITGSKLFGGQRGLLVNAVGTAEISDSDLSANSLRAVENATSTAVDASGNWWGSNVEGDVLAETLGLVDVTPYLDAGTDGNGATRGFAGDFSHVHVTTLGQQTGSSGRIQEGINAAQSLGTVTVEDGTYDEVATINQSLTVVAASPLGAIMAPTTGAQQSVLIVAATDVTIDGLQLRVNQDDDGGIGGIAPIAPVGISATPLTTIDFDGLRIQNVKITSIGNSPANWTGSPSLTVRAAGIVLYASGVPSVEITDNDINVTSGTSFFQRAVWLAQLNADVTGNTIAGFANDLLFQFASGGASLIDDNDFVGQHRAGGAGVNISGPNANAPITISNNNFAPIIGDPANIQTGIVINQNWNGNNGSPVNIVGNTFTGEVLGILSGNSDGLTIDSNVFTPAAGLANTPAIGGDFLHIAIDSDAPSSGDLVSLATQADVKNNTFNAAAGSEGTAISVANNLVGGSYDEVTIGVGGDNTYDAALVTGVRVVGGVATVSDSISGVDTAVQISGGTVTLAGSSLTNNTTGVSVSGTGSLTVGTGNTITGGTTGLLLDGAGVSVAGNDLNDLSMSGQLGDYITLANTAFDDQELDGSDLTLGGTLVSAMTPAQLVAAGAKITDELDNNTLGLVDLGGIIVVTPTSSASLLDNDYLRIKNAIEAAEDGDTIIFAPNGLDAEFNWDEPFALASWEDGNDGLPGTDDDFGVQLPGNLDNVTVTADDGDNISIQGPGDMLTSSIEAGFIVYFNGVGPTTNTNWTFSNFAILDIDNAFGFFYSNGNDFSGLTIDNMHIVVPADSTGETGDFQNIGIHYGAGQNISITNNLIEFVGTGDGTSLGIQSSTHGGANYDGLNISNNQFVVLGAGTEEITGVWENGHTHLSDIAVSGNTFTGLAGRAGEQIGFLVTSHSSATTTVTYSNNSISNADVGIDWLDEYDDGMTVTPQVYTGTQAVVVANNIMTGVGTGIRVGGVDASGAISGNSITGASGVGVDVLTGASVVITSGSFQNLDIGIRVAGAAAISGADFNAGTDNETDIQLLASAGVVTLGAGNLFGGTDYFIDNASANDFDLAALGYGAANYEGLDPGTLADAFAIENRLRHEVDAGNAAAGLIRVVNNTLYVTTPGAEVGISDETIQGAIDAAMAGDTIHVQAGTFNEYVVVDKQLTLLGAQAGTDARGRVATESVWSPLVTPDDGHLLTITVGGVTVDGFTFDGLTTASSAIRNWDDTNNYATPNLTLQNNIIRDLDANAGLGITLTNPAGTPTSGLLIFQNDIIDAGFFAIDLSENVYGTVDDNSIHVPFFGYGIASSSYYSFPGTLTLSDNEITGAGRSWGIYANLWFGPATSTLDIIGNTINVDPGVLGTDDDSLTGDWDTWGINLWSINNQADVNLTNNVIGSSGGQFSRGINVWNALDNVSIVGGSISNSEVGINIDATDPYYAGGFDTDVAISNVAINGGEVGVRICNRSLPYTPLGDSPPPADGDPHGSVTASLSGVVITGATTGILVKDELSSDALTASVELITGNSITGGTTGLAVDGEQALVVGDSLGDTIFSGQSDYYVSLVNDAMNEIEIDGTLASFAGFIGGSGILADNFAIEDKLRHATDDAGVGHVRFRMGEVFVTTPGSGLSDETIQNAIDAADAGDTVHVAAGMFSGVGNRDLDVSKKLIIDGDFMGTTIIDADGLDGFNINASGSNALDRLIIKDLTVTDATGGSAAAFRIDGVASFVTLDNVAATGNNIGFLADNTSDVDDLDIVNSTFTNNVIGIYSEAETSITNNQNLFDDILLQNLTVSGNSSKGIYLEKANNLTFDNVVLTHAVTDNGLDLNLKYGDFQNVLITGSSFINTGGGTAAHIKGRNDVYGVSTDLVGLSIQNSDFTSTAPTASGLSIGNAVSGITFSDADFLGTGNGILFYVTTPQMLDLADSDFVVTLVGYVANATPFAVDGTDATYDGIVGNTATPTQGFAITDKMLDAVDVSGLGLVRIVSGQVFVTQNSFFPAPPFNTFTPSVQRGVDAATTGDTVWVNDGTYTGNVVVNKNLTLVSANGRGVTTLQGVSGVGSLGTLLVTNNTTDFNLGSISGNGFTIVGIDNNNPGIENAAVYFQGGHTNAEVRWNDIVANGDHGFASESGAAMVGLVVDNNIFSGQTFVGTPADNGFTNQFTTPNVPRQLFVLGSGSGTVVANNITFTNNLITGTAGGSNGGGEQGNTLVTLDALNSVISDNTFSGTTTRFGHSLRARGANNTITDNVFNSATMGTNTVDVYVNRTGNIILGNTFSSSAGTAIQVDASGGATIGGTGVGEANSIAGYNFGITVGGVSAASATIVGNTIYGGNGVGIAAGANSSVLVQENDLTGNTVGVGIAGGTVDLGQLGLGTDFTGLGVSSGGNDFSGYTLAATAISGAIVNLNANGVNANAGPQGLPFDVPAFGNTWAVATPTGIENVVWHDADDASVGFIDYDTLANLVVSLDPLPSDVDNEDVNEGSTATVYGEFTNDAQAHTVTIDWGDGSPDTVVNLLPGVFSFSVTSTIGVTYTDDPFGSTQTINHGITVTVEEDANPGNFLTDGSLSVDVNNVIPTATLFTADGNLNEGETLSLDVGPAFDPGTDVISAYRINWGDGTNEIIPGNLASVVNHTHQYLDGLAVPNRTVTLDIFDEDGTWNTVASLGILVNNIAPTAGNFFSFDATVNEGSTTSVFFVGPFTDPGNPDTPFRFAYDFNGNGIYGEAGELGDGTYTGSVVASTAAVPAAFLADDDDSPRTIRARIIDNDGGFTEYSVNVNILNVAPVVNAGADANAFAGLPFNHAVSFTERMSLR
ncbi:MAG: right-handed parallel beta-helix repeat-containing protein [Bythopirellula sp.]|nr:right-handed parallel beta-helix repeat-containing protein [Bythopirellula sp.]